MDTMTNRSVRIMRPWFRGRDPDVKALFQKRGFPAR
jgi:hypothetical protein